MKLLIVAGLLPFVIISCRTQRQSPMTEKLFMQYKRVNISYPADGVNDTGGAVLSEQVTYNEPEISDLPETDNDDGRLDTNKVYSLAGVTVASKLRFTSIRDGHVNVDFVIKVPKELISDDYRMQLTPELIFPDTIINLEHVVLLGKNFIEKQKQDYEKYDEYLKAIVPKEDYDKVFLDREGIADDLKRRQQLYWEMYASERNRVMDYWEWRNKTQERFNHFNSRREAKYRELYHYFQREGEYAAIIKMTQRQDTVGTSKEYEDIFKKIVKKKPSFRINREIKLKTVPKKYRDIFKSGTRPNEVQNFALTELDSINIASHRYFYDQIVMNEMRDSLREEEFKSMVPYTDIENIRYSITLNEAQDFTYLFTQEYLVKPGMKNLQIHLKGRIDAVDHSGYDLPRTDTLNYLISSLEELADAELAEQKLADDIYQEGYSLLVNRDYVGAMKILGNYNDYNMALSLACQGYNQQAYALLRRQPQTTALVQYLNAIVSSRLSMKTEAVSSLEKACKLDTSLIYRCMRDSEIKKLIKDYNLQERLNEIEFTSMN